MSRHHYRTIGQTARGGRREDEDDEPYHVEQTEGGGFAIFLLLFWLWQVCKPVILPIMALFGLAAMLDAPVWVQLYLFPVNGLALYLAYTDRPRSGKQFTVLHIVRLHLVTLAGGAIAVECVRRFWLEGSTGRQFQWSVFAGCWLLLAVLVPLEHVGQPAVQHGSYLQNVKQPNAT